MENVLPATPVASTSFSSRNPFEELCSKQKSRRVELFRKSLSPEELSASTVSSLKCSGKEELSNILQHLIKHPEDIKRVQGSLNRKNKDDQYSPEKALGLLVSLKLSKFQYLSLRESANELHPDLYPSYYQVKLAKEIHRGRCVHKTTGIA